MVLPGLLLGVVAVLCWPDTRAARRMRVCLGPRHRRSSSRFRTRWARYSNRSRGALLWTAILASVGAVPVLGLPGSAGAVVLVTAVWRYHEEQGRARVGLADARHLAEALRTLVAELRAGALPAAAAESAAAESQEVMAGPLRRIAATERLGGDPATLVPGDSEPVAGNDDPLRRIGRFWGLARRYGLPYAEVLDALRRDVDGRARRTANAHAGMAGPRSSAVVLAVLPALGLALGEAMGARPLHVLTMTASGHLLLGLGCVLIAFGLLWSARLTRNGASL